ncbi:hypothetical protein RI054_15g73050 [Pseudoscourfieldia marina]
MAGANLPLLPETLSDVVAAELPSGDDAGASSAPAHHTAPEWFGAYRDGGCDKHYMPTDGALGKHYVAMVKHDAMKQGRHYEAQSRWWE